MRQASFWQTLSNKRERELIKSDTDIIQISYKTLFDAHISNGFGILSNLVITHNAAS